ncbi:MAG: NAD-dependent epimerase/dehydratase family protein [Leptospiraceae bacterium]|nr:NAD-dependent epimerase/dehydratase family protein [Leptospiraceae bacterium]MCP5497793.1 NAD-dependent epimerase/dehydratase family protein [Leptospiraceae bacterium]
MKVAIVGGNGNIGFHVAEHLLKLGHEVFCLNRRLSGNIPDGAQHILCDRNDEQAFIKTVRSWRFDMAIDMICYNAQHAECSVQAFQDVKHLVVCSSVATYGRKFATLPVTESCPANPQTDRNLAYAVGKHEADLIFLQAYQDSGFPVTFLKPSISYGPKMGLLRQIGMDAKFINRIETGRPIIVAGDGIALHQFMYVDDVGRVFALLLGKTETIGESFNLAQFQPISWHDYHQTVMEVLGYEVEQIGVPADVLNRLNSARNIQITDLFWENCYFSTAKLQSVLPEFHPQYSLKDGIKIVIESLKSQNRVQHCRKNDWEDLLINAIRRIGIGTLINEAESKNKHIISKLFGVLKK